MESILLYIITTNNNYGQKYFEIRNIHVAINGNDLQKLGITPSKIYSDCFEFVLKEKLNNPNITKSEELNLAKIFFKI